MALVWSWVGRAKYENKVGEDDPVLNLADFFLMRICQIGVINCLRQCSDKCVI